MQLVELKKGDIFVTRFQSGWLGRGISWFERFWASDDEASFSHAGFVMDPKGETFEALTSIKRWHIANYRGARVRLGRHVDMDDNKYEIGWLSVKNEEGDTYPYWRLLLHMFPPLARRVATGEFMVCSELTAHFLTEAVGFPQWKGVNPDYLADAILRWDMFEVVADGILGDEWSCEAMLAGL
jgi:hypothetical protein